MLFLWWKKLFFDQIKNWEGTSQVSSHLSEQNPLFHNIFQNMHCLLNCFDLFDPRFYFYYPSLATTQTSFWSESFKCYRNFTWWIFHSWCGDARILGFTQAVTLLAPSPISGWKPSQAFFMTARISQTQYEIGSLQDLPPGSKRRHLISVLLFVIN